MGDRLGTLGAVGNTYFLGLSTKPVSQYEQQVALWSTEMLLHTEKLQNCKASLQFCSFCQCKITAVANVCPNFTRSLSKHANQTEKWPWPLNGPASKSIWRVPSWHLYEAYLPGTGVNHDHLGGSPRARLLHCTSELADPCDFPKCGKLECVIYVSGELRSR